MGLNSCLFGATEAEQALRLAEGAVVDAAAALSDEEAWRPKHSGSAAIDVQHNDI